MTGSRGAPRSTSSADPTTPKSRAKPKSARSRSSPTQKKSSPSLSMSAGVPSSIPTSAATAAAAAAAHQQAMLAAQRAGVMHNTSAAPKRARSSGGGAKEPDAKRAKAAPSPFSVVPSRPGITKPPGSPTTSSRSRQRKSSKSRGNTTAVGEEASGPSSRVPLRARPPMARTLPLPQQGSCFSVEATPFVPIVRPAALAKRLFGHEIQCLMHAFGEVRYCARDVLEMTEDAVREAVIRTAILAHRIAMEESRDGTPTPVAMRHVAWVMHGDPRAIQRLNQSLKNSADMHTDKIRPMPMARMFSAAPRPWERFAELALVGIPVKVPENKHPTASDVMSLCSWRALHAFRSAMGPQKFQDFAMCRGVTLVRQDSKSRAPTVRGQPRIALFREWIGVEQKLKFPISDEGLFALGHVAWEAIGLITQTALLHRYFDDIAKGLADPRVSVWSYPRHLIAALNYGIGTAVMVPLTELQGLTLRQELDSYLTVMQVAANKWRGYSKSSSPCLLPQHVREALRRLQRAPDSIFGFRDTSFLLNPDVL